jgi:uncharacterized protein (TIGR02246 family)
MSTEGISVTTERTNQEVLSSLREFFSAVENRDLSRFLGLFTAAESLTVFENSEMYDWPQFRTFAETFFAELAEVAFDLERCVVDSLGDDVAVATGVFRAAGKSTSGDAFAFRNAFTFVLVRRDAGWRIAHVHESSL